MMKHRLIFIILLIILLSYGNCFGKDVILGQMDVEIKQIAYKKDLVIELVLKNDSDDRIIVPKIFLELFEDGCVISDWLNIKDKNGKEIPHDAKFVDLYFNPDEKIDKEFLKNCIVVNPKDIYKKKYKNFLHLFSIPFWCEELYIQYQGPLGVSNVLKIDKSSKSILL